MRTTIWLLGLVLALGYINPGEAQVDPNDSPREVMVTVADALIPSGFDSQSDVVVVVSGVFPNGCYRWSKADVKKVKPGLIEVRSFALVHPGMCIMVLVPYIQEVSLGRLDVGQHKVRFINGDGTYLEKTIEVQ